MGSTIKINCAAMYVRDTEEAIKARYLFLPKKLL